MSRCLRVSRNNAQFAKSGVIKDTADILPNCHTFAHSQSHKSPNCTGEGTSQGIKCRAVPEEMVDRVPAAIQRALIRVNMPHSLHAVTSNRGSSDHRKVKLTPEGRWNGACSAFRGLGPSHTRLKIDMLAKPGHVFSSRLGTLHLLR